MSIKKIWGQITCGAFVISNLYALIRNIHDSEVIKICLYTLLVAFSALFAIKLGTGAISKIKPPDGTNRE